MTTPIVSKWRAALDAHLRKDADRAGILAAIQKVAPESDLAQIPAIAASLAALVAKGETLAADVATEAASRQQHRGDVGQRNRSRVAFDRELRAFRSLVENNAASAADITGMGFTLLTSVAASKAPPDPPASLVVRIGRARGKARVAVQGSVRGRFAAEGSLDPAGKGPWFLLPGAGKERQLTGYASGTKVWVRFATIRWGMQSAFCTPVLVTIP